VGEHHVEIELFKDFEFSPSIFSCCGCEIVNSAKLVDVLDITLNDPSSFACTLFKGLGLDDVKMDSFPHNIVETEPYAVDEGYLSACYRFITLWMFMLLMSGGIQELEFDVEFEFGPYDGDGPKLFVILDPKFWSTVMFKKDLNPELLRWFLLLQRFEIEVRDKG